MQNIKNWHNWIFLNKGRMLFWTSLYHNYDDYFYPPWDKWRLYVASCKYHPNPKWHIPPTITGYIFWLRG